MRPRLIKQALKSLIAIRRPAFIRGGPGIGKSDVVLQVADELYGGGKKWDRFEPRPYFIDIRALLLDPVDLRGIPMINGDHTAHWCPPEFLPILGKAKAPKGIIFWDELSSAPPLVQAATFQAILDHKVGEAILDPNWAHIAAGNRETDKSVTHRMPSPLANRFIHIQFEVSMEDFAEWWVVNGHRPEVLAFLRFNGGKLLNAFDPKKNDKSFPTPRSWMFISEIMTSNPSAEVEVELYAGTVGEGAASEFVGYLRTYRSIPDPREILKNPTKAKVPTEPAVLYAVCGALAHLAEVKVSEALFTYSARLPAEFSVLLTRDSVQKDRKIIQTKAFIEWASKHSDILI